MPLNLIIVTVALLREPKIDLSFVSISADVDYALLNYSTMHVDYGLLELLDYPVDRVLGDLVG